MTEFEQAKILINHHGQCSQVFLQRKLKIGYLHAGRVIDELEKEGIIGPKTNCRERTIIEQGPSSETTAAPSYSPLGISPAAQ